MHPFMMPSFAIFGPHKPVPHASSPHPRPLPLHPPPQLTTLAELSQNNFEEIGIDAATASALLIAARTHIQDVHQRERWGEEGLRLGGDIRDIA